MLNNIEIEELKNKIVLLFLFLIQEILINTVSCVITINELIKNKTQGGNRI